MAEQFSIPTPGDVIAGTYTLVEELGRGAYGVVFRARQHGMLERDVAVKTLLPHALIQDDLVTRFQREASLVSKLQHPNIVTLYDFGQSEGTFYMVMELVEGQPLSALIRDHAPLPPKRAVAITRQILAALGAAHRAGIVHRDLKPENIVLADLSETGDHVKILDFGIAKIQGGDAHANALKSLTAHGIVLGTPHYMSPENITGEPIDERADLYAVGILLYELLAGVHPFDAPTPSAVLVRHLNDPIPPLPDPAQDRAALGLAVRYALAKDPQQRAASAQDLLDVLEGRSTPAHLLPPPWYLRPSTLFALSAVIAALTLASAVWLYIEHNRAAPAPVAVAPTPQPAPTPTPPAPAQPDPSDTTAAAPADTPKDAPTPPTADTEADTRVLDFAPEPVPPAPAGLDGATPDAGSPAAAPPDDDAAAPASPDTTEAISVVNILSTPANATVLIDGKRACTTPCAKSFPQDARQLRITVKKRGYKTQTKRLTLRSERYRLPFRLQPGRIKLNP